MGLAGYESSLLLPDQTALPSTAVSGRQEKREGQAWMLTIYSDGESDYVDGY